MKFASPEVTKLESCKRSTSFRTAWRNGKVRFFAKERWNANRCGIRDISIRISRLYGDPLIEPELDPFPDAYLEKLARVRHQRRLDAGSIEHARSLQAISRIRSRLGKPG